MRKSLKIAAVAAALFLALGAVVFVYANQQNSFKANDDQQIMGMQNMQNMQQYMQNFRPTNGTFPPGQMKHMNQGLANNLPMVKRFLQNATLSDVQGTVVSEFRGMLILDTGTGQVRVLLPKFWSVDNGVVGRAALFNSSFAMPGDNVTVGVLKSDVFANQNFSINVMVGYEATNATGTHAYAVLPFNIVPNS